jgi:SAM-dependent methyltransferase
MPPVIPLADTSQVQPDRTISPRDGMIKDGLESQYFELGRRALELILFSGRLCDKPHYHDILDLPCGHGRVLRWLRAHYGYARITACDLDHEAVDFCRDRFQAEGVYSQADLAQLSFPSPFELVWCGSLLTHLSQERWLAALDCLVRWTREYGVIVFTTQGRSYTSLLARGRKNVAENIDKAGLLAEFTRSGFAYERYFEPAHGDYGVAVASPEWVGRALQRHPEVILRAYLEEAWGMQDVVILYKKTGHYEPVLGAPATPLPTVRPMWLARLRRLLGPRPGVAPSAR